MLRLRTILAAFLFVISFWVFGAQDPNKHGPAQFDVGVILDFNTLIGKMAQTSIAMAVEDFYEINSNYTTRLVLHTRDGSQDDGQATLEVLDLLQRIRTKAIIGPQKSSQADNVADFGNISHVPVISFTSTSPTISSMHVPYFIRTAINDVAQVKTITSLIKAYGWREVVLISEDTEFGWGIIPFLTDGLQKIHVRVPYRSLINISSTNDQIQEELYKLQTMPTRVFIVHMSSPMDSTLFLNAKEVGMTSEGYVWIMTSGVADMVDSFSPRVITAMKGALGVRLHVPKTDELDDFTTRWKKRFHEDNDNPKELVSSEPSIYALWAYDTIYALAMAVENLGVEITQSGYDPTPSEPSYLPVLSTGPQLLRALLNIKFQGLAGNFELKGGQLHHTAFEIINLVGKGIREIGYWTEDQGLSKELEYTRNRKILSTSQQNLNPIIWPGESTTVPKGWEMPVSGRKLRVGVIKGSYPEFMNVEVDPATNAIIPSGYAVEVFHQAINRLPFGLQYEYQLFGDISQAGSLTYDDLVYQVHLENYDMAIGDITIRYNRTLYADFSVAYTESGVAMVVPVKKAANKNAFILLQPFKTLLWIMSFAFAIVAGIVQLLWEPTLWKTPGSLKFNDILTCLQLSMLSYQENLESIPSKIISIAMFFLLLVLKACYTANLFSMLTVQHLQPATNLHDLILNGEYVGYAKGSFVEGLLLQQLNFEKSKIKGYNNMEDWHEALENRRVAAIVDEVPYIRLFLAKHCNSYTMIPLYKTAGFGYAFPKDSPLVPYISRAILNITGGDDIIGIEKTYIGDQSCPDNRDIILKSNRLGLDSFWALFVLVGAACIVFLFALIYKKHTNGTNNDGSEPDAKQEGSNNADVNEPNSNIEGSDNNDESEPDAKQDGNNNDVNEPHSNPEGSDNNDGSEADADQEENNNDVNEHNSNPEGSDNNDGSEPDANQKGSNNNDVNEPPIQT